MIIWLGRTIKGWVGICCGETAEGSETRSDRFKEGGIGVL
jgi:hypothetical protein